MEKKPNIIMIMTDQQRLDTINALGYDYMITPNMDRLVRNGTAFTNAYCTGATCVASRASLFTGLYPHNTGVYSFDHWSHQKCWVEDLADRGYHCVNIGKMHVKPIYDNVGFHERKVVENKAENYEAEGLHEDEWGWWLRMHGESRDVSLHKTDPQWKERHNCLPWDRDEELHSDIFTGNLAKEWINNWQGEEPLFLQIGFPGPHDPYDPPARYMDMYEGAELPKRIFREGELEGKPPQQQAHQDFFRVTSNDQSQINTRDASDEDIRKIRLHNCANVTLIDEKIGEILQALEEKGLLDNSVVLLLSDHGDNLGDHKLPYKWLMYDGITNIPLVIADFREKREGGKIDDRLVSLIDVGPTILEYGGIPVPGHIEGESLNSGEKREYVYCEDNYLIMVRNENYKLVYYIDQPYGELYDLKNDPGELVNLHDDVEYGEVKNALLSHLLAWLSRSCYFNKTYKTGSGRPEEIRWPGNSDFRNYLHGRERFVPENCGK